MLAGIGGRTIEEAQNNMTYSEVVRWQHYRNKRGGFNIALRLERSAALLATLFYNRHYKTTADMYDFMPYEERPEQSAPTFDEVRKAWGEDGD